MFGLGFGELLLIAVVMLLLFGRRLPEVGKSLGKGIVEFKKGIHGVEEEVNRSSQAMPPQANQNPGGYQQQYGQAQQAPFTGQVAQQPYAQPPYPQQYQQLPAQQPPAQGPQGPVGTVSRADQVH
jgi:sec-independent protein translocase protein TatA